MHLQWSIPKVTVKSLAQARFEFGTDGSAQKSTTAYRAVKQLPQNWIRTVSWLNQGVVHVVTHEPLFISPGISCTVSVNKPNFLETVLGSTQVIDPHTLVVTLTKSSSNGPPALAGFSDDPFAASLVPVDCGFDLQVWTA